MKSILNDIKKIEEIDKGRVAESISLLSAQMEQILENKSLKIPKNYQKINKIVLNGMGASNLGAGIIKSIFSDSLKVPLIITPGYEIPSYVDKETLYILSSYSGTTEEPLSVYNEVKKRHAKILAITAKNEKNKLAEIIKKDNIPALIFNPEKNPSNQPRIGLGYAILGIIIIIAKTKKIKLNLTEIKNIISFLKNQDKKLNIFKENNIAKKIALKLYKKQPIIIGAEFFIGNLRVLRNQFCENSKNFASYLTIPELNHYALESLINPKSNKEILSFFFLDSNLYHPRIQKRSELTKQIVKKNKIEIISYEAIGKNKMEQSFEILQIGTWVTFYLAILNEIDPSQVPWVDWFKKELK